MQKQLTQQHLRRHPEKLERFDRVRIWSDEWGMWWRPSASGYTPNTEEAGVYDAYDAWARVKHCGPEKRITLVAA
ncbi:hypothetical protein [Halomonas elongata]|uniref:hypothetical protein n=1 Tax=Halomonas elongata TaxID=2746 RepID=UPI00186BA7D0|nr:hypothetical protein [Halomonas elongata]MBW5801146.1 hypothetical protein [Halomonas elongata]